MVELMAICGGAAALGSSPFWLPQAVLALRERIFEGVNGPEGIAIPGKLVDASQFKRVYAHPAANGRSEGAALSDLFWYWLSPGAEVHQEHLEAGDRYDEVAKVTRQVLSIPNSKAEQMAARCMADVCGDLQRNRTSLIRLRDTMMRVWARFYHEVVFGNPGTNEAQRLIIGNANDVVTALKCSGLRHMGRRDRLTAYLLQQIRSGEPIHALPSGLSQKEQALYLQGVFFNTAIVQMSEAMTHLLLVLAQNPAVQQELLAEPDDRAYDRVIAETLRQYPLFGIAHRITTEEIVVDEQTVLDKGSVLCFHYADYQRTGFRDPDRFDPDRWKDHAARDSTYIPFGVAANRPCPAQAISLVTMRAAAREFLRHFTVHSSVSHTRSIPHRGPCLLEPRHIGTSVRRRRFLLSFLWARDRVEDVTRSLTQLVLGTGMVLHARHLRLAERHFAGQACPFKHQSPSV